MLVAGQARGTRGSDGTAAGGLDPATILWDGPRVGVNLGAWEDCRMKGLAELTKTTLIGGLLVVLPIYVSVLLMAKTLAAIFALLSPITAAIPASTHFRQIIAIVIVLAVCLLTGFVVRTRPGRRARKMLERSVLTKIPGYSLVQGLTERVS